MNKFAELGLSSRIVEGIEVLGFTEPTPIQAQVIPAVLNEPTDLIALAQTGTGKTAAFGLPLVEMIDVTARIPLALILAPTRELCVQIENDLRNFSKTTKGFQTVAVYGGASIRTQIEQIRRGVQVVVATPGRLIDLITRKALNLSDVQVVVLDEADEMLNMGFMEDIDTILAETPEDKQTWLFSATMPTEIRQIIKKYMSNPVEISSSGGNKTNENIEHQYYMVEARNKYPALKRILDFHPDIYGIIFCRTKAETQDMAERLIKDGYNADSLHGDLTQMQRDKVMNAFREKTLQVLIATDVAARGIDVDNLTHVLHLHLPDDMAYYTHRAGRTARAGKTGVSCVLVTSKDLYRIKQLERTLKIDFKKMMVPDGMAICEKQLLNLLHRVNEVKVDSAAIARFMPVMEREFAGMDRDEIMMRFASLEFNRFLDYYRFAEDLNVYERRETRDQAARKGNMDLLFINLGKMDHIGPKDLLVMICQVGKLKAHQIGDIRLKGAYSFIEVPANASQTIIQAFNGFIYRGRRVRLEIRNDKEESFSEKRRSHKGSSREMPRKEHGSGFKKDGGFKKEHRKGKKG